MSESIWRSNAPKEHPTRELEYDGLTGRTHWRCDCAFCTIKRSPLRLVRGPARFPEGQEPPGGHGWVGLYEVVASVKSKEACDD